VPAIRPQAAGSPNYEPAAAEKAKIARRGVVAPLTIVSIYARGISGREIQGHLRDLYGDDVSADLVSAVTDAVLAVQI